GDRGRVREPVARPDDEGLERVLRVEPGGLARPPGAALPPVRQRARHRGPELVAGPALGAVRRFALRAAGGALVLPRRTIRGVPGGMPGAALAGVLAAAPGVIHRAVHRGVGAAAGRPAHRARVRRATRPARAGSRVS